MKWLTRLFISKKRTPMPPVKPYTDHYKSLQNWSDPRLNDPNDYKSTKPDAAHWEDPRFKSRDRVPFFDLFGFNQDWSWTTFKILGVVCVISVISWDSGLYDALMNDTHAGIKTAQISAAPDYARNDDEIEKKLREGGFTYVRAKKKE